MFSREKRPFSDKKYCFSFPVSETLNFNESAIVLPAALTSPGKPPIIPSGGFSSARRRKKNQFRGREIFRLSDVRGDWPLSKAPIALLSVRGTITVESLTASKTMSAPENGALSCENRGVDVRERVASIPKGRTLVRITRRLSRVTNGLHLQPVLIFLTL